MTDTLSARADGPSGVGCERAGGSMTTSHEIVALRSLSVDECRSEVEFWVSEHSKAETALMAYVADQGLASAKARLARAIEAYKNGSAVQC